MQTGQQEGIIDLAHLAKYTGGEPKLDAEILTLFKDQTTELVQTLGAHLADGDAKGWRAVTHTLKGAARGVGAFAFADAAAAAEQCDPVQGKTAAEVALATLGREARQVQRFIDNYLR
jgi:HPt (histidine-containing phosphotransfer) domain-containing protein